MVMSTTALYQFQPGRIDHHNVQILCGVGGVLLLARALVAPNAGWAAGALIGLGLVVGLESATLVAPVLVVAVLMGVAQPQGLAGAARACVALAATLLLGVVATTSPARLGVMVCDAAALNLAGLVTFGAAGVGVAHMAARFYQGAALVAVRLAVLAVSGLAGLGIYGWLEPACLAGPFGQVSPETWPVWLLRVTEGQPITYLFSSSPRDTTGFLLFALVGIAAQAHLLRNARVEPSGIEREILLLVAQMLSIFAAVWQVKMMPYAAWLAIPAIARMVSTLGPVGSLGAPTVRLGAFLAIGQTSLTAFAGAALAVIGAGAPGAGMEPLARTSCSDMPTISALASLPPGLVLADLNLGPYVVALSSHRVVSAPYHRLDRSIVLGDRLLHGPAANAESALRKLGVTYVLACRAEAKQAATLEDALATGRPPAYLQAVPLPAAQSLLVYSLTPAH